jgi:hypothetical protein
MPKTYYRIARDAADWTAIMGGQNEGWFRDIDCTEPATPEEVATLDGADVYSTGGWNTPPAAYPCLVHMTA